MKFCGCCTLSLPFTLSMRHDHSFCSSEMVPDWQTSAGTAGNAQTLGPPPDLSSSTLMLHCLKILQRGDRLPSLSQDKRPRPSGGIRHWGHITNIHANVQRRRSFMIKWSSNSSEHPSSSWSQFYVLKINVFFLTSTTYALRHISMTQNTCCEIKIRSYQCIASGISLLKMSYDSAGSAMLPCTENLSEETHEDPPPLSVCSSETPSSARCKD